MKTHRAFAALAVLAVTGSAQGALFSGWNNTPDTWEFEPHPANAGSGFEYSSSVGVTEGTHSLLLRPMSGFSLLVKNFSFQLNSALIAAGIQTSPVLVMLDLTIPAGSFDSGGTYLELNLPRTGSQTPFTNTLISVAGVPGNGPQTITFTLPAGDRGINPSFYGIFIGLNTNRNPGAGVIYVDNLRISPIPEPASLSLVGAMGLGLLRRRR